MRVYGQEVVRASVSNLFLAPLGLLGGVPHLDVVVLLRGHRRRVVVLTEGVEVLLQVPLAAVLIHDALREASAT